MLPQPFSTCSVSHPPPLAGPQSLCVRTDQPCLPFRLAHLFHVRPGRSRSWNWHTLSAVSKHPALICSQSLSVAFARALDDDFVVLRCSLGPCENGKTSESFLSTRASGDRRSRGVFVIASKAEDEAEIARHRARNAQWRIAMEA